MTKPKWVIDKERARKAARDETVWLFGLHAVRDALVNPRRDKLRLVLTRNAADRLGDALARFQAGIRHLDLDRISPLAVPVMLEIGKEAIHGEGHESILEENAEDLIAEATGKR